MHAERLILETDSSGKLKQARKLPPNKQLEAIFLVIADSDDAAIIGRRPHPDIVGKTARSRYRCGRQNSGAHAFA